MNRRIGFVGWRGMVGQVLAERIAEEQLSGEHASFHLMTTSQPGQPVPPGWAENAVLLDAFDLDLLREMDVVISCQGGSYTSRVHGPLRRSGWTGYWIDAASTLRLAPASTIVLDPVNLPVIERAIEAGKKDFAGGNCTVSLMLMALGGLFRAGLVEWVSFATYQAASGAGAAHMRELLAQMTQIGEAVGPALENTAASILELDRLFLETVRGSDFENERFGVPCAGNLVPWIGAASAGGRSQEEQKSGTEAAKILDLDQPLPIDGNCVRVGTMRSHCQSSTIKLAKDVSLAGIEEILREANPWVRIVPNDPEETIARLHPVAVSGTPDILVGRLRKMAMGSRYASAFSCGDQLIWGAAEPLVRVLKLVLR